MAARQTDALPFCRANGMSLKRLLKLNRSVYLCCKWKGTSMNAEAQIRKGRKFDQVIEGAKAVFLREGFEGASVDEIARDAGVSKATLYSYFPDKQHLFLAVLETECAHQSEVESCSSRPSMTSRRPSASSARR
jgi:DNA-binding transcriptional regulator YbjK